ncbi:hypothetical protein [Ohtaekwangia koreensis]|uniref:DUF3052 domain-containing protein n=1 Tax=Ohtaekwangia koreensis TaxID=688867 RepID=A0A1T5LLC7_9BACT|nr:hypothetical protein [Ohtaekwangia koreensis]SKC76791.1 hypothetical protein SAMN05660236_3461 [Ohtaekwangia koreensis]
MNPIFKKLNYKNQEQAYIINPPDSFKKAMDDMNDLTTIKTTLAGSKKIEFVLAFVTKQKEVDDLAKKISPLMEEDGLLWFAYPKGSSKKYTCEFNRDTGWIALGKLDWEPVRMVAIDEDWSALRFRKAEHIKTMTRSSALSETGKRKIAAAKGKKT